MKYGLIGTLLVAICLGWLAFHYHGKYTAAQDDISSTEAVTNNAVTSVKLFNDIARSTQDAKQDNSNQGETVRVVYKTVLAKSPCSVSAVDRDVADRVLDRANKIRSGSISTNSRQFDR